MKPRLGVLLDQFHGSTVVKDRKAEGIKIGKEFARKGSLDARSDGGGAMTLPLRTRLLLETVGIPQEPAEHDANAVGRDENMAARDAAGLIERRRALKRMIDDLADFSVDVGRHERVVIVLALVAVPRLCKPIRCRERNNIESKVTRAGKTLDGLICALCLVK